VKPADATLPEDLLDLPTDYRRPRHWFEHPADKPPKVGDIATTRCGLRGTITEVGQAATGPMCEPCMVARAQAKK
jgi:hypothetical protein